MNPTSRLQASLLLLLMGAAYFFGFTLFLWACCVCATVYIVRCFAALSSVAWVSLLAGIALMRVFLISIG